MNHAEELKNSSLFREIPAKELKKLGAIAHEHTFAAHEVLFREGDTGDDLMVIVMGTVKVSKASDNGADEEIASLGSGSYFGEVGMVTDEDVRAVTVEAMEKTFALGFKQADLEKICNEDTTLGYHVYRALARAFSRRFRKTAGDVAHFKALALHHS